MIKQLDLFAAFAAAEVQPKVEAKPVIKPAASNPVEIKKEQVRISAAVRKAFEQEVREFGFGGRLYQICREKAKQELADIQSGLVFASPRYKKMLKSY